MLRTDKYSQHSLIIRPVWQNRLLFVCKLSGCGFESHCCHLNFRCRVCFEQGVPWHSGNECRFTLKRVRDMLITYSQMHHRTDKYSQHINYLARLAKWLSVRLQTNWLWVPIPLLSLKPQLWRLFRARSFSTFRQLKSVNTFWNAYVPW